jgi:hypothetical protein
MAASARGRNTAERLSGATEEEADVATNELAKLAAAVERQTTADGVYDTAVPGLRLYRSSAPSDHDVVVRLDVTTVAMPNSMPGFKASTTASG